MAHVASPTRASAIGPDPSLIEQPSMIPSTTVLDEPGMTIVNQPQPQPQADDAPVPLSLDSADASAISLGPVITAIESDVVEESLITGPLIEASGCLYVDLDELGIGALVFLHGTTWDEELRRVRNFDGTSVGVGEVLNVAGGGHPIEDLVPFFLPSADGGRVAACAANVGAELAYVIGYVESIG